MVDKACLDIRFKILPLVYDDSLSYYEQVVKLVSKTNEVVEAMNNLGLDILDKAHEYTDEQITQRLAVVNELINELEQSFQVSIQTLQSQYNQFESTVNSRMNIADANIRDIQAQVDEQLALANAYTQQAIANNNEYIIDQTTKALSGVKVLNYFTGARVSIQEMFDYLAQFHLDNAISVQTLVNRAKTVNQLVALRMAMTDLATNGGTIITP